MCPLHSLQAAYVIDSAGENFLKPLWSYCATNTNVRILAQGTNTGPCLKIEELNVYIYKINSKSYFLI